MRALAMGQYGHNNQPAHHVLWLLFLVGDADSGNAKIREVIDRAYGVDFFAGDEDNGEMGAWFVLAALGLAPSVPQTSKIQVDYEDEDIAFLHFLFDSYEPRCLQLYFECVECMRKR